MELTEVPAIRAGDVAAILRAPGRDDYKYSRGTVSFLTGSDEYPGAARLGVEAAVRAGVGMVRYLGREPLAGDLVRARPEIVLGAAESDAYVLGSGIADLRIDEAGDWAADVIASGVPCVLDGGGLELAGRDGHASGNVLLTPHLGEFATLTTRVERLRGVSKLSVDEVRADAVDWAQRVAASARATVLLKGASTIVVDPDGGVRRVEAPTSVLATAGTGDVLAGLAGALIAIEARAACEASRGDARGGGSSLEPTSAPRGQRSLAELGAAAAWLHGRAALLASLRAIDPGRSAADVVVDDPPRAAAPVTAMAVAEAVPGVIGALFAASGDAHPSSRSHAR